MTEEDRQILKGLTEVIRSLERAISNPHVVLQQYQNQMPAQTIQPNYPNYPPFYPAGIWGSGDQNGSWNL